ncbi:hypothetical protein NBEOAGPD_0323 [Methylobacterium gregans]|uniref:Uncharacterized protein n=1 Tax=Methylobacterium gregans TaxID=374424 RepID=A0AA37HKG9_9HYPH|nr:hypothetical protein NBEOAGPD_0323 [Methylobacterium gregans]
MSDLILADETAPATIAAGRDLSPEDLAALRRAVRALEQPGLAARLSAAAGAPLEMIGRSLPAPVTEVVGRSTEAAMRGGENEVAHGPVPRSHSDGARAAAYA